MADPLDTIVDGCWLALRFGLCISSVPTAILRVEDGVYRLSLPYPGTGWKTYHALEAALVGATATGDWRADVATVLGVDQAWISGFLDGFAQEPEARTEPQYVQGYLAAEQLRTTRYRRQLPDRCEGVEPGRQKNCGHSQ